MVVADPLTKHYTTVSKRQIIFIVCVQIYVQFSGVALTECPILSITKTFDQFNFKVYVFILVQIRALLARGQSK